MVDSYYPFIYKLCELLA